MMATTTLQATLEQARRLLENNDTERAIAVIQHILKHFPKNLEAERMLGEAYFASREYEQAKEAFQRVLAADPENIPAHFGLGLTYERMGRIDGAVSEFEQALEIKPDMPELRNQLLRLYSEAWGKEGAQLRLSRPGLARLYAKGNMLTQAVQEFRGVVTDHPDRLDAQIGLAEALWRDGQEDAAAAESEAILARHPDALKANLLLGYIRLASGDPAEAARGTVNWRTALELDPQQIVAQALFETLPSIAPAENSMPAWDEGLWLTQQATARIEEEQRSYAQVAASNAVLPTYTADDESFLSDALFQPIAPDVPDIPEEPAEADILARLFAAESKFQDVLLPDESEYTPVTDTELEVTPFSFDDLSADSSSFSAQGTADDTGLDFAFNLEERSVEDAPPAAPEPFSFDAPEQAIPQVGAADADEPDMTPFSFADLGLSPDEIALMQAPADDDASAAPTLPADADEPDMTPFSFADLGLSPDEIALMQGETATPDAPDTTVIAPNFDEPLSELTDVQPFDWSLDVGDDIASPTGQSAGADSHMDDPMGTVQPFSWVDLDADAGGDPFSFEQAAPPPAPPSKPTPAAAQPVQPFSLDDLNLDDPLLGGNDDSLPISLQPFSMDDLDIAGLTDDDSDEMGLSAFSMGFPTMSERSSSTPMDSLPTLSDEDAPPDNAAYSWQTPSSRAAPSFASDNNDEHEAPPSSGESIFNKLKQRRQEIVVEEEPLAPVSLDDDDEAAQFFSTDDVSLRIEETGDADECGMRAGIIGLSGLAAAVGLANTDELTPPEPTASAEPAEPALTPFSFEDLGLSPDEIAQLEGMGSEAELPPEIPPAAATPSVDAEPELTPFSLTDLGLSPDEIAALEAMNTGATGDTFAPEPEPEPTIPSAPDEPELTPFSLTDLGLSPDEIAMLEGMNTGATGDTFAPEPEPEPTIPSAPDEPELTPFSLTDLGLSPDEIAMLEGMGSEAELSPAPASAPPSEPAEPELTPFTLSDLGLSPDEIAMLESMGSEAEPSPAPASAPPSEPAEPELTPFTLSDLGLSPDEIAMLETTTIGDDPAPTAPEPEPEPTLEPFQALPIQPFSAADFGLDNLDDESFDSPTNSVPLDSRGTDTLSDLAGVGIQPFSIDDIGLDDSFSLSFDNDDDSRLGLTEAELSGLDFSGSPASTSHSLEDALQILMDLGKQQGFVDLTDIINAVENPLAEPERIEEIGQALHQAGIEIRDGDEIIPMDDEEVYEDEEYVIEAAELAQEPELAIAEPEPAVPAVLDVSAATEESFDFDLGAFDLNIPDFSEADLAQEIAAAEPPVAPPAEPAAPPPAPPSDDEPIIAPLSLADFGLSPEEIAMLGLDAGSGLDAIQDVTDTSASEPVAPVVPEPEPESPAPAPEDDFGLSTTQLDKLRSRARSAEAAAESKRTEPEVKPFSLEDLGLSPAEIEGLGLEIAATAPEPEGLDDSFDFGMLDAMGGAPKVERTRPRPVDEPPPPPSEEDVTFTPEPLEGLDDIWDTPPSGVSEVPARVVLPPRPEPRQTRVLTRPLDEDVVPTARARDPRARPLRADRKEAPQRGGRYVSLSELRASGNAPDTFADPTEAPPPPPRQPAAPVRPTPPPPAAPVAPAPPQMVRRAPIGEQQHTGNAMIDQYIDQLAGNPDNVSMRLAVARLSAHAGYPDVALQQYKLALRSDTMLAEIGDDLHDLIDELSDPTVLRRLYRLLGDIYTRQGDVHRAMQAYSWTP